MTQLNNEHYAVKVPEGAKDFKILKGQPEVLDYEYPGQNRERDTQWLNAMIDLPPGSYTFLFCTSEATEEQARKVVLKDGIFCRNYSVKNDGHPFGWTDDPLESLETLLASKGCEGNWAVVRRK
jgi:hypothetical protein